MQQTSIEEFEQLRKKPEDCNLEFKEAKGSFSPPKLFEYCAAIANENGGKLILGVHNKTREVVGTNVFQGTYNTLSHEILKNLSPPLRVDVQELHHPKGRVLIFHIPPRKLGQPVKYNKRYWMRVGESTTDMDDITLKNILNETEPDFSSNIVEGLTITDIDEAAVVHFKTLWAQQADRKDILSFSAEKTLRDIGVLTGKGLNYAALILFGKAEKIDEILHCNEIIFEWKQEPRKISSDFRKNWRAAFFSIYNEIWDTINARNLHIPFRDGLFERTIPAFDEQSIREALLNAVAHRDYRIDSQSIFITASPDAFSIESPGGFLTGITPENVVFKQAWRNRKIAEVFEKANLVERAGHGMDIIFESSIKAGKGFPDLSKSDPYSVRLSIPARVKDEKFILFLEQISRQLPEPLSFEEIYELDHIREKQKFSQHITADIKKKFLKMGLIEKVGATRGIKYVISHKYYSHIGKTGIHTALVGVPRQKQKELILLHFQKNKKGSHKDFQDIFPELRQQDISTLLQELKGEKKVRHIGARKQGFWERGIKYVISHENYSHIKKTGVHTALAGISRKKQKELILLHLQKNKKGSRKDFQDIFPDLKQQDISNLLQELKGEKKVRHIGARKQGFWELLN